MIHSASEMVYSDINNDLPKWSDHKNHLEYL